MGSVSNALSVNTEVFQQPKSYLSSI